MTARLTDEEYEAAMRVWIDAPARAVAEEYFAIEGGGFNWDDLAEDSKELWRQVARAGIAASYTRGDLPR